jgi:hypothetical protein
MAQRQRHLAILQLSAFETCWLVRRVAGFCAALSTRIGDELAGEAPALLHTGFALIWPRFKAAKSWQPEILVGPAACFGVSA